MSFFITSSVFADVKDITIDNSGLPEFGKKNTFFGIFSIDTMDAESSLGFITKIISEAIKYAGVLAIIALMIGGLFYITSYGDPTKIKRAKDIIVYSIVGVVLSISAYTLISIVNNLTL